MADRTDIPGWLQMEYPFTPRRFITASGAGMSYVDEGEGSDAVLMLHGNPTWSFYYRDLIKAVSPRVRCIAPDHVGMGLSDRPRDYRYTLKSRIGDITDLVAALGLRKVHLVVHDWGGAIGFGLAERRPDLIGRIVVLNTAAFASPHLPARIALCKAPLLGPLIVRGANGFARPATWMGMARRRLTDTEKHGLLWPYGSWRDRIGVNGFVQDIPMNAGHETWETLERVERGLERFRSRRALIVWGGRDFCFNDHFFNAWRERLPAAEAVYLADAGHYVLLDADREVVPRIAAYLTSRDSL